MDDQQARDVEALVKAGRDFPFIEKHGYSSYSQLVEALTDALAALPVAPEQPTRANEEEQEALEERLDALLVPLIQQFEVDSESDGLNYRRSISLADALGADIARDIAVEARVVLLAALVSSPSVETVTPDKEAIVREVLDWIEQCSSADGYQFDVADQAREHFGVSS